MSYSVRLPERLAGCLRLRWQSSLITKCWDLVTIKLIGESIGKLIGESIFTMSVPLFYLWSKNYCALLKNALIMKGANLFYKSQISSSVLALLKPRKKQGLRYQIQASTK